MERKRITVIENDQDSLYILKQILESRGYSVDTLTNGNGIFANVIKMPDLFILGWNLPTIDGIAICKYLRVQQLSKHIPVIIISAHPYREKAIKAGVSEYLAKPFDVTTLVEAVDRCLKYQKDNHV